MIEARALLKRSGVALVTVLCAGNALAHHSAAMFDQEHKITLTGTVRAFQWTNPHCYIQLMVPDKQGRPEEWSMEMAAPIYLQQLGWRPVTLKAGDKVTINLAPLRKMPKHKGGLVFAVSDSTGKAIGKPMPGKPPEKTP